MEPGHREENFGAGTLWKSRFKDATVGRGGQARAEKGGGGKHSVVVVYRDWGRPEGGREALPKKEMAMGNEKEGENLNSLHGP